MITSASRPGTPELAEPEAEPDPLECVPESLGVACGLLLLHAHANANALALATTFTILRVALVMVPPSARESISFGPRSG
jgi:hypothetical protein